MADIAAVGGVTSFRRRGDQDLLCAFNLSVAAEDFALPAGNWQTVGADLGSVASAGGRVTLGPWALCLALRV